MAEGILLFYLFVDQHTSALSSYTETLTFFLLFLGRRWSGHDGAIFLSLESARGSSSSSGSSSVFGLFESSELFLNSSLFLLEFLLFRVVWSREVMFDKVGVATLTDSNVNLDHFRVFHDLLTLV